MCRIIAQGMVQDINRACTGQAAELDIPEEILRDLRELHVEEIGDDEPAPDFANTAKGKRKGKYNAYTAPPRDNLSCVTCDKAKACLSKMQLIESSSCPTDKRDVMNEAQSIIEEWPFYKNTRRKM